MSLSTLANDIETNLKKIKDNLHILEQAKLHPETNNFNMEQLANNAITPLKTKVQNYLVENFKASGLKSRTGNLLKTVQGSNVWIVVKGSEFVLRYGFKRGEDAEIYKYGAAQIYGATRNANGISGGGKRKIKKGLTEQGVSHSVGVSVTPAHDFYRLTPGQFTDIRNQWAANMQQLQGGHHSLTH